ncbi:MAG TPA: hypothetical protein VNT26_16815, partial [Candidatus Sulfotelmatobacter sp.]|nr:hypothetical protein [Candidatus Sulfotelmatobacter sp.]
MKAIAYPLAALLIGILGSFSSSARASESATESFTNEPAAQALYNQMLETLRSAKTLSWVSDYHWEAGGKRLSHATYKVWLKKPDYARLEAMRAGQTEPSGILVGDGECFWVYWPREKPRYDWENTGKYAEEYNKHRRTFYRKERSPGRHYSIGHQTGYLGAGLAM